MNKPMNTFAVILALSLVAFAQNDAPRVDANLFSNLQARNLGPAVMSGRVSAIDAVVGKNNRLTLYVGSASGGVWKSENGGTTLKPIFDKYTQSIGAVT